MKYCRLCKTYHPEYDDNCPLCGAGLTEAQNKPDDGFDFAPYNSNEKKTDAKKVARDVFIAISTSGNSKNIVKAIIEAKKKNVTVIGLVGKKACEMDTLCDYIIKVQSESTPTIQESHIMIGHIICALVEEAIFKGENVCLSGQKHH